MWVARDRNGRLVLFEGYPTRDEEKGEWYFHTIFSDTSRPSWEQWCSSKILDRTLFPNLKWSDEPKEVNIFGVEDIQDIKDDYYQRGYDDGYDVGYTNCEKWKKKNLIS